MQPKTMYQFNRFLAHSLAYAALTLCGALHAAEFERKTPMDEQGFGAASETFSVIVVPQSDHLKLLLERFGVAHAVTGAKIALHSTEQQASATEVGEGAYRADGAWLLEPGKKALAVTITAEGEHDVVVIVFDPAQSQVSKAEAAQRESKYGPRKSEGAAQ